ncbi:MAG: lipid A biosynthesis acyltransferase, partial [Candidatus Rokuibacteriota bacterium]
CTTSIEDAIGAAPEQWLWLHNRWRTRPPAESRIAP